MVAAFLLIALFIGTSDSGFASGIPSTLHKVEDNSGPPAWLSEEALRAAMDDQDRPIGSRLESVGYLFDDWQSLFSELERYAETKAFTIAPDGTLGFCEPQEVSYYWDERAKDLKRLVELSTAVTSVLIADSKPGFLFGRAGELLEVEVLSVLKDTGTTGVSRNGFFLFDSYARMMIDGKPLCKGGSQVPRGEFLLFQTGDSLLTRTPQWPENPPSIPPFSKGGSSVCALPGAWLTWMIYFFRGPKSLSPACWLPSAARLTGKPLPSCPGYAGVTHALPAPLLTVQTVFGDHGESLTAPRSFVGGSRGAPELRVRKDRLRWAQEPTV